MPTGTVENFFGGRIESNIMAEFTVPIDSSTVPLIYVELQLVSENPKNLVSAEVSSSSGEIKEGPTFVQVLT